MQGGFKGKSYLVAVSWVAQRVSSACAQTDCISVCKCRVIALPPCCSEMNRIEPQRRQLKCHTIAKQRVDNGHDLAMAVIAGMEACS